MTLTIQPVPSARVRNARLGVARLLRRRRSGLGEGCPGYAPYGDPETGCSNVPKGVDAHRYYQSGGKADEGGVVGKDVFDSDSGITCEFGVEMNPATGRLQCKTEKLYTTPSGYVIRTHQDVGVMQAIAAEAEAQGKARGLNISCKAIPIGGDLLNANKMTYGTDCTVNGTAGHDAALLLTASGFEIAAVEAGYRSGKPVYVIPQFNLPRVQGDTAKPVQTALPPADPQKPKDQNAPVKTTADAPPDNRVGDTSRGAGFDLNSVIDQAKTITSGLPSWALPAAGVGLALILFWPKGGRR